jgi:hypothetical protein
MSQEPTKDERKSRTKSFGEFERYTTQDDFDIDTLTNSFELHANLFTLSSEFALIPFLSGNKFLLKFLTILTSLFVIFLRAKHVKSTEEQEEQQEQEQEGGQGREVPFRFSHDHYSHLLHWSDG